MSSALPIPENVRRQATIAVTLAAVAGCVDAYGIIRYGAFLSYMSGNTTLAGYRVGHRDFATVPPLITGVLAFLAGSFCGAFFMHETGQRRTIFLLIAAALLVVMGLIAAGLLPPLAAIAFIGFVMGAMNTSLSRVGAQSVNLTFVTGTLSRLGKHLALAVTHAPLADGQGAWDTHLRRALLLAPISALLGLALWDRG